MKPLLKVFTDEAPPSSPPCWFMRQAGRYLPEYQALRQKEPDFMKFVQTPDLALEATLQPLRRYPLDAAIVFSDILVVPFALGQTVWFDKESGPHLEKLDLTKMVFQADSFEDKVKATLEVISRLKKELPEKVALIGFSGAPWTLLSYMLEGGSSKTFKKTKLFIQEDSIPLNTLLTLLIEAVTFYLKRQIETGAEVIQLFDTFAGEVPFYLLPKLVFEPTRAIVKSLKQDFPSTPIIGFPKGLGGHINDYVTLTGVDGISLDSSYSPQDYVKRLMRKVVFQAGPDPYALIKGGAILKQQSETYLKAFQGKPFIFNLSHGILPETPPDHLKDLIGYVKGIHL
jgi:uroporphyrinogen decarboxylase